MKQERIIANTTILLAAAAGFCDAATFVAADQVFSAHVGGNLILFVYDIIRHTDGNSWIRVLTVPVFIGGVVIGSVISRQNNRKFVILRTEGVVLLIIGLVEAIRRIFFESIPYKNDAVTSLLVFGIVAAMGLQTSFARIFTKEKLGSTGVVTASLTQAALEIGTTFTRRFSRNAANKLAVNGGLGIGGFLAGCFTGALSAGYFGLQAVMLPGISILIFCLLIDRYQPVADRQ